MAEHTGRGDRITLAEDGTRRAAMGSAARARALRDFRTSDVTRALLAYYDERLSRSAAHG